MARKIRLVCATRDSKEQFLAASALGRSLTLLKAVRRTQVRLFAENRAGLPTCYNQAIAEAASDPAILVFVHDDVGFCDFFWADQIEAGLKQFDIIGLAGNKHRVPGQPGWAFVGRKDGKFVWDDKSNLSGVVGHGEGFPCKNLSVYGPSGQACKLLDGLLLAVDSAMLEKSGLRFDPRFAFHLYDLDFCRQAEALNLRMGTWPISVVHKSGGSFGTETWQTAYRAYLEKYGEAAL
jgi:GT2 family glycosyltransferase